MIPTERRSVLISLLSTEVAEMVFAYANPDDPYDVSWHKLEEVFAPPQTAQLRFWRFQTREQLSGETVDEFYRSVVRLGREAYPPNGRQAPLLH